MASRRKRKRNKIVLFVGTLCGVLLCGSIVLLLFWHNAKRKAPELENTAGQTMELLKKEEKRSEQKETKQNTQNWEALTVEKPVDETAESEEHSRYGELLKDPDRMKEENIYTLDAASEDEITLLFAGDILFDDGYSPMVHLRNKNRGIEGVMSQELLELMRNADVFMLNNEFPYSKRGVPLEDKAFTFRADPETAAFLTDMGVDVVSLANNHAYDHGRDALLDTFDTLENQQIPYVGAGRDLEEASDAVCFILNDYKIGILSATQIERLDNPDTKGATETTPGVFRCWNVELLLQRIREVREECDYLIVFIHWGTENVSELDWAQEKQSAEIAQAGADLVVGAHPHCLQKIAMVGEVPVVYSLGNFWFNSRDLDTGLVQVKIPMTAEQPVQLQFIPAKQKGCETFLPTGEEKERILNEMRVLSSGITLDEQGYLIR